VHKSVFTVLCLAILCFCVGVLDVHAMDLSKKNPSDEAGTGFSSRNKRSTDDTGYYYIGLDAGYLNGHSTYHISSYSGSSGVESELAFPLQTFMAGVDVGFGFRDIEKKDKVRVNVRWLKNIDNGSGKMQDSDWLTNDQDILTVGSAHPGKDIYSESDIKLNATIVDVNAVINAWQGPRVSIGPLFGYKYEKFVYDVRNTNQVGYGPYGPGFTGIVPGKTLDYEVTYRILYAGVNADILPGKTFRMNIMLGFSPWTLVEDRDDHILRSKLSTAEATGTTYLGAVNAEWEATPRWSLKAGGEYMKIYTTGTQHQSFYAGPNAGISFDVDDKITSVQWFVFGRITYLFFD
jgi:outer membrane protease